MAQKLDKLTVMGFKSIRELENFELNNLNVLIGANGAGKSNFVEIFRLLRAMVDQQLSNYVSENGGGDGFLFNGPKVTEEIAAEFEFGANAYKFKLRSNVDERLYFAYEGRKYRAWRKMPTGNFESSLPDYIEEGNRFGTSHGVGTYVYEALSSWTVYHFHDTSNTAPMRRSEIMQDNKRLRANAANIAPFLLGLRKGSKKKQNAYQNILDAIRLVIPFFDDFILEPSLNGERESVKLSWVQKGSDYPMQPYHLSDGSIRFICLATALHQPNPPSTIIIDEPELGLHPYALTILAELIQAAAKKTQVIISTQSPALVDHFQPEDLIVVNRKEGASVFDRLNREELEVWLEQYSLGELWQKNVVSGGPTHE